MVIVNQEEIIEISAHFAGRFHDSIEIKLFPVRERRKIVRQGTGLNLVCHMQFTADSLLLCLFPVFLFQRMHFFADIPLNQCAKKHYRAKSDQQIKPGLFIKCLFLGNPDRQCFAAPAHSVFQIHHKMIHAVILHIENVGVDVDLGVHLGKGLRVHPVRGCAASIQ